MRNKLIIAAVVLVGLASVAYAAFSQILTVNGTGTATGTWDVRITGITRTAGAGATDHASTPTFDVSSATFNVDLAYPGAYATYEVVIENQGNVDAKLSTLTDLTTLNAAAPADLKYTVTGVAVNDVLAASGTATATVKVEWLSTATASISSQSKSATIEFNYVQN